MKVKELNRTQWTFCSPEELESEFDTIEYNTLPNGEIHCLVERNDSNGILTTIGGFIVSNGLVFIYGERELK